jgi:Ser/Thr protein kinase RdoA (MazF antagonist)
MIDRDQLYRQIDKRRIKKILSFYDINGEFSFKPIYGGWRKACFLVRDSVDYVLTVYPPNSLPPAKILQAASFEDQAAGLGLPARRVIETVSGHPLCSCRTKSGIIYAVLYSYQKGDLVFPYGREEIGQAGLWLSRLHQFFKRSDGTTLVHGDFARGNLLFDKGKLSAIIDFEEARWGQPKEDIATSLSFFYQDCSGMKKREISEIFLSAYDRE